MRNLLYKFGVWIVEKFHTHDWTYAHEVYEGGGKYKTVEIQRPTRFCKNEHCKYHHWDGMPE